MPALAGDVRDVQGPRGRAEEREGADEEQRDGDRGPEQADTGEQAGAQEVHEGEREEDKWSEERTASTDIQRRGTQVQFVWWVSTKKINFSFFRGDYEDFDIANEDDNLEEFLGI